MYGLNPLVKISCDDEITICIEWECEADFDGFARSDYPDRDELLAGNGRNYDYFFQHVLSHYGMHFKHYLIVY